MQNTFVDGSFIRVNNKFNSPSMWHCHFIP